MSPVVSPPWPSTEIGPSTEPGPVAEPEAGAEPDDAGEAVPDTGDDVPDTGDITSEPCDHGADTAGAPAPAAGAQPDGQPTVSPTPVQTQPVVTQPANAGTTRPSPQATTPASTQTPASTAAPAQSTDRAGKAPRPDAQAGSQETEPRSAGSTAPQSVEAVTGGASTAARRAPVAQAAAIRKQSPRHQRAHTRSASANATPRQSSQPGSVVPAAASRSTPSDDWVIRSFMVLVGLATLGAALAVASQFTGIGSGLTAVRSRLGSKGLSGKGIAVDPGGSDPKRRSTRGIRYRD